MSYRSSFLIGVIGEQYILTKYCKCNSFQVITDLLNSENLKVAIAQLYL